MPSNPPIRQHTVPCSYLSWFSDVPSWRDSVIEIYDIKKQETRTSKVSGVTIEKDFYTLYDDDWNPDYRIEHFFAEYVESGIRDIVDKIEKHKWLSLNDRKYLSEFIAFQEMRSTFRRNWDWKQKAKMVELIWKSYLENMDEWEERSIRFTKNLKEELWISISNEKGIEILQKIYNWEDFEIIDKEWSIRNLWLAPEIAELILHRKWFFIEAPKWGRFITSDYPVFLKWDPTFSNFYGVGYWTAIYIGFPISKNVYLMAQDLQASIVDPEYLKFIEPNMIRELNLCTAQWGHKWIMWPNKKYLEVIFQRVISRNFTHRKHKRTM